MSSTHSDPQIYNGTATFNSAAVFNGAFSLPDNTVTSGKIPAGANISADKLQHRLVLSHQQKNGTDVISETLLLHIARAVSTIRRVSVRPTTAPTGGDKQYTVDVQKAANGSSSWTSILSAAIVMSSADANDTLNDGTLSGATLAIDDALRIVITASGSTGSQGQGFVCVIHCDENGA